MATTQRVSSIKKIAYLKFAVSNQTHVVIFGGQRVADLWVLFLYGRIEFDSDLVHELFLIIKPLFLNFSLIPFKMPTNRDHLILVIKKKNLVGFFDFLRQLIIDLFRGVHNYLII